MMGDMLCIIIKPLVEYLPPSDAKLKVECDLD